MNENQSKKMKTENSDSLKLLMQMEVHAFITQHLTGLDYLKLSEVSHSWNRFVAESEDAMAKFQLVVDENWDQELENEVFEKSQRKYKHLKVKNLLRTRENVVELIHRFSESLETIDTFFDFDLNGLQLPNVKSLSIHTRHVTSNIPNGLMSAVINLKSLRLSGATEFPLSIISCLKMNPNLEELELNSEISEPVFSLMTPAIAAGCRLKKLSLDSVKFSDPAVAGLMYFLVPNIDSITELKILQCEFNLLIKIFAGMRSLRRLTYSPLRNLAQYRCPTLKPHQHLEELNLIHPNLNLVKGLVGAMPKLKTLYIADPSWDMFEHIAVKAPNLLQFRYAFFTDMNASLQEIQDGYKREIQKFSNVKKGLEIIQI